MICVINCVLVNEKDEILLLRRTKDRKHSAGKWHVIAGHIEKGETPEQTLKREMMEEAGITNFTILKTGKPIVVSDGQEDYEVHTFIAKTSQPLNIDPREHDLHEWVTADKIKSHDIQPWLKINLAAVDIFI